MSQDWSRGDIREKFQFVYSTPYRGSCVEILDQDEGSLSEAIQRYFEPKWRRKWRTNLYKWVKVQVFEGAENNDQYVNFVIRQSLDSPDVPHDLQNDEAKQEFVFLKNIDIRVKVQVFGGAENNFTINFVIYVTISTVSRYSP